MSRPVDVALESGNDFADIFAVKHHDFALGDPRAPRRCRRSPGRARRRRGQLVLADPTSPARTTQLIFSQPRRRRRRHRPVAVELEPHERWEVRVDVVVSLDGERIHPDVASRRFGDELARVRDSLAAWQLRVPHLRACWDDLGQAFSRSVADLASLRMRGAQHGMASCRPPACRGS